jgi:phage FluMu gp28-like protein
VTTDPTQLLCPFQAAWLRDRAPLAIGEKSRRIGWTWTQALGVVLDRVAGHGNYYHSSADQTASVEFIDYCAHWAGMVNAVATVTDQVEVIDDSAISSLVMKFANGTKIVAGSSNPKFFRSKGGAVGLDEFAFHRDGKDLYKAAHATALFWGHPLRIWSTHNGPTSYFNGMIQLARRKELKASVHTVTIEDAVRDGIVERIEMRRRKLDHIPAPDEGARRAWLDELRGTCPDQDTWDEEYMCVPSTDGASLLTYDLIRQGEVANLKLVDSPADLPTDGGPLYAGFDVGRKHDRSVLWVVQRVGDVFWTRMVKVMAGVDYTTQEGVCDVLLRNRNVKRLCVDATGIGAMLAERLAYRYGSRAEQILFTAPMKSELAMPLVRLFQDKLVRVPADADVREDLHKVRKVTTAAGNVRLEADRDEAGHSDRFWALALAGHAADSTKVPLPPSRASKPVGW